MMTPELAEQHERAAVALENDEALPDAFEPKMQEWEELAWRALLRCECKRLVAARLLRECIARNEVLR